MTAPRTSKKTAAMKQPEATSRRTFDDRIDDFEQKIKELKRQKAASKVINDPVFKYLKATCAALGKAVGSMDGRKSLLNQDFIRTSRQYLNLLQRALDEFTGYKRRGRKPKMELGS